MDFGGQDVLVSVLMDVLVSVLMDVLVSVLMDVLVSVLMAQKPWQGDIVEW